MKNQTLAKAIKHWDYVAPLVAIPKNDKEFNRLVSYLDDLLDMVGSNEKHPLMGLIDIVSHLVTSYEEEHWQNPMGKGVDALNFLMNQHDLKQSDLSEIASQGVMSEILNGKRSLNLRQIRLLAKHFKVNASTFIDD